MCFRLALRALLLAGREPWLAFLRVRCGLDMVVSDLEGELLDRISGIRQHTMVGAVVPRGDGFGRNRCRQS